MRISNYSIFLLLALIFFACSQSDTEHGVITVESSTVILDEVMPPLPGQDVPKFNSISEWLSAICAYEKPDAVVDKFCVGMFESDDYYLYFVGKRDSFAGNDHYIDISFKPEYMYHKLPSTVFSNLPREKVSEMVSDELRKFVSSDVFKPCFLSNSKAFITEYNGEDLLVSKNGL